MPTENLRFREESLTFKVAETVGEGDEGVKKFARFTYPTMTKTQVGIWCKAPPMICCRAVLHGSAGMPSHMHPSDDSC